MAKSSEAEQARRVNATIQLLKHRTSVAQVLAEIVARYGVSPRQAYRYLEQAQQAGCPLVVPQDKSVFTVKLPRALIVQVRRRARQQEASISAWVEQALRWKLERSDG